MGVKVVAKFNLFCLCLELLLDEKVFDWLIGRDAGCATNEEALVSTIVDSLCSNFKHLEWSRVSTTSHLLLFLDATKGLGALTIFEMSHNRCIELWQSLDNRKFQLDSCFALRIVRGFAI